MSIKDIILHYIQTNHMMGKPVYSARENIYRGINKSYISRKKIDAVLKEMEEEGTIATTGGVLKDTSEKFTGTYYNKGRGNGTVALNRNGNIETFFVPGQFSMFAPHGSEVQFVVMQGYNNESIARVVNITKNSNHFIYGSVVFNTNGKLVFVSDDSRYHDTLDLVPNEFSERALNKRCCMKVLIDQTEHEHGLGIISDENQIFGNINSPLSNIEVVLKENNLVKEFPPEVLQEVSAMPDHVNSTDLVGRLDLRDKQFVTIDPSTCKDMDDAVCVEKIKLQSGADGYRLYVAIADVSHYVKPGSVTDKEAYHRGNSNYPAGGVVAMLHEQLSNGICSLNPHTDRLAMITTMDFDVHGNVQCYDVQPGVINSKRKFSYEEVSDIHQIQYDKVSHLYQSIQPADVPFKPQIDLMYQFSSIMQNSAHKRGALTIQGYEPTIILNRDEDNVVDYRNDNKVDSHKVIEQFMIVNNSIIANLLNNLGVPNLLRIHESPSEEKMTNLITQLTDLGISTPDTKDINAFYAYVLLQVKNTALEQVVNELVVCSMKRAQYSTNIEIGHQATALLDYTHFTSPIRRYVDLVEHRLTKSVLEKLDTIRPNWRQNGQALSEIILHLKDTETVQFEKLSNVEKLNETAFHLNVCEEVSDTVSTTTDEICAAIYMQKHIGEVFTGIIRRFDRDFVTVTLHNDQDPAHSGIINVLIPIRDLGIMEKKVNGFSSILATEKGVRMLGDELTIKIISSDPTTRTIFASTNLEKELVYPNHSDEALELKK